MKAMSSDKPQSAVAAALASIVGSESAVCLWENIEVNQQNSILEAIASSTPPRCIVYPQTQDELARVIALANDNNWRVLICGSGSKIHWGGLVKNVDVIVSTQCLNRLVEHAVGDLTITVEAGMRFADIQAILLEQNQFLALDPSLPHLATIGGIVATSDSGSLRQCYGGVRDQLLGVTFVRADGEIAKAGGRVVKNVAGYDLMKLFTGSYGSLSVITQVTFRVYPLSLASRTVVLTGTGESISQAANILRNCSLTPTQADLLSSNLISSLGLGKGIGLIACFQSIGESVQEQSNRLLEVGQQLGLDGAVISGADEADLWKRLQEQMHFPTNNGKITCKIGITPTAAVDVLHQVPCSLIHISSGLGTLQLAGDTSVENILQIRQLCQNQGGFLTILSAPKAVKEKIDVWGYQGNALGIMRKIKSQFDARGILNPSRFVGGI